MKKAALMVMTVFFATFSPSVNASPDTVVICSDSNNKDAATPFRGSAEKLGAKPGHTIIYTKHTSYKLQAKELLSETVKQKTCTESGRVTWDRSGDFSPRDKGYRQLILSPRDLSKTKLKEIYLGGYKDGSMTFSVHFKSENEQLTDLFDERDYNSYFNKYASRGISVHNYKELAHLFFEQFTDLNILHPSVGKYILKFIKNQNFDLSRYPTLEYTDHMGLIWDRSGDFSPRDNGYRQLILSPRDLSKTEVKKIFLCAYKNGSMTFSIQLKSKVKQLEKFLNENVPDTMEFYYEFDEITVHNCLELAPKNFKEFTDLEIFHPSLGRYILQTMEKAIKHS